MQLNRSTINPQMAVEVMHLPNGSPSHTAFSPGHKPTADVVGATLGHKEHSRSSQDLSPSSATYSPSRSSAGGDSLSAGSELSWNGGSPEEQQAVERIQHSRKQLEDEIDVSLREKGEECGCMPKQVALAIDAFVWV